jgi:hypothetical protein
MRDPFADLVAYVHSVSAVQQAKERVLAAYRNNIVLPDLAVADKDVPFVPKVIGEDGQEMTWERRQALMKDRPVMLDENRRIRGMDAEADQVVDYRPSAEGLIETAPLGANAEANRKPIQVVTPRVLDLPKELA